METWVMWALGIGTLLLPFILAVAFNGRDIADARGRRTDRHWRAT